MGELVTGAAGLRPPAIPGALTLVWIDSREATLARRVDGEARFAHIVSDVPAHRRATGHVRHDPRAGHGGHPRTAGDRRRLQHLAQFLDIVARRIPCDENLLLIGPGMVHERLARLISERDTEHGISRRVAVDHAARLTRHQLAARLARALGEERRRRTVGAYRWSSTADGPRPGGQEAIPRRVYAKPGEGPADEGPAEKMLGG